MVADGPELPGGSGRGRLRVAIVGGGVGALEAMLRWVIWLRGEMALTFRGEQDADAVRDLLRQIEDGVIKRVAFALPRGASWALPLGADEVLPAGTCAWRACPSREENRSIQANLQPGLVSLFWEHEGGCPPGRPDSGW